MGVCGYQTAREVIEMVDQSRSTFTNGLDRLSQVVPILYSLRQYRRTVLIQIYVCWRTGCHTERAENTTGTWYDNADGLYRTCQQGGKLATSVCLRHYDSVRLKRLNTNLKGSCYPWSFFSSHSISLQLTYNFTLTPFIHCILPARSISPDGIIL